MNTFLKVVVVFCALSISRIQAAEVEDLRRAALAGECDKVQSLLTYAEDFFVTYGYSLLHLAAQVNHVELSQMLISCCSSDLNRKAHLSGDEVTPLYLACQNGHLKVVRALIKAGADTNIVAKGGRSPLAQAASNGHADVVRHLLAVGVDITTRGEDGLTAFMKACYFGRLGVVVALQRVVDVNELSADGYTALYCAVQAGHAPVVEFLLNYTDAYISRPLGKFKRTPLIHAAQNGRLEVVRLLVNAADEGCDINQSDSEGTTPLYAAVIEGYYDVVEFLLDSDADATKKRVDGRHVLHAAITYPKIMELLVKKARELDVNEADCEGMTALYIAVDQGCYDVVKILKEAGADITKCADNGLAPLDAAIAHGHTEITAYLES